MLVAYERLVAHASALHLLPAPNHSKLKTQNSKLPSPAHPSSPMLRHSGLRFLLPYMLPYRGKLLLGTIYAIIGASASAFSPTLLGRAIDAIQQGIQLNVLLLYSLGLIGLAVLLAIFRYRLRMLTGRCV